MAKRRGLKLEIYVAQAGGDFVDNAVLVGFVFGGEGDAEPDRRLGVVPRHGGDEFFADEPLRKPVANVELSDFFVVFCLCNFAVLECGSIFPKLRLIGGLKFAQFFVGGAACKKCSGKKQQGKLEDLSHAVRRVRLAKRVVKQPSRKKTENTILP